MTKLEKLYSIIENSKDVGVKLTKDVLQQVEELEEGIIKDEILPALSKDIAPRLDPIRRDLVLVVEYHPGEPISVALSRKVKISDISGAITLTSENGTPVKSDEKPEVTPGHEPTKHVENPTKGLRVSFPNGVMICQNTAIDTMIAVLRMIGLERIPQVGITHNGYNLVGKKKRPTSPGRIWQHECDGWYIYSNISNDTKAADLQKISDFYNLSLKIENGKPNTLAEIHKKESVPEKLAKSRTEGPSVVKVSYQTPYESFGPNYGVELEYNYDTDELRYTIRGRGGSSKTLTRDEEEELKKYLRNRQNIEDFFETAYSTDDIRLGAHYRSHSMSMEYGSRKKSVSNGEAKSWEALFIKICY